MSSKDVKKHKEKKPLKILVVAGAYPPSHGGGGLRVHRTYQRISKKLNLTITVITLANQEYSKKYENYDGVVIHRVKPRRSAIIQFYIIGKIIFRYKLYNYDIMHGVGSSLIVVMASIWGKILSLKLMREVTVYDDSNQVKTLKKSLNYLRFYLPLRLSFKNADLVIALNDVIMRYYIKLRIPSSRIWVRPNPVDTNIYYLPTDDDRSAARCQLGITSGCIVYLLVGQFEPRKNQRFAVELFNILPKDHKLFLVGPVIQKYKWYYESVLTRIREKSLEDNIFIISNYINDLSYYYRSADIVLIPSVSEGTPNVMLEALCCGIPVLVNKSLQLNEYIEDGMNGWNVKLDVSAYRNRAELIIKDLLFLPQRVKIASEASRKYSHVRIDDEFIRYLEKAK
jgi:glycosyltransferase involved in cell wall biosynthesis